MKMSQAWKNLERKVAKAFGLKRNLRGADFSQRAGDITAHPVFTFECKFRKHLPMKFVLDGLSQAKAYDRDKIPVLVCKRSQMKDEIVSLYFSDFVKLVNP